MSYYKNLAEDAEAAIQAQRKTISDAKEAFRRGEIERNKLNEIIALSETQIKNLKEQIIEYEKQKKIYKTQISNLERDLAKEKGKVSFWKKVALFGTAAGVVLGVILAKD